MGKIEEDVRKRRRKAETQRMILDVLATAGVISVAVMAPNVLGAMRSMGLIDPKKMLRGQNFNRAIARLKDGSYLKWTKERGKFFLEITEKGREKLRQLELRNFELPKPKRWDKKWRIIIFDIPETRKKVREQLRNTLIKIGFVKLQHSVWVYPYDCEDLLMLFKADLALGKNLLYIVADSVENDMRLRNYFNLPAD